MLTNWQRLDKIIKWTGLSVNAFALSLGLKRSENLYQIKRGNNGISRDLAERITTKYPTLSKGWILSGEGSMFIDQISQVNASCMGCIILQDNEQLKAQAEHKGVPFYHIDLLSIAHEEPLTTPTYYINIPIFEGCDLAAINYERTMSPEIEVGSMVLLKRCRLTDLIPGESYLIRSKTFTGLRTIRTTDSKKLLALHPKNRDEYDPITIEAASIENLFQVQGVIVKKNL